MKVYLVGGAVRDMVMGKTPKDRDWVVVGSSEKEMISLGYKKVGMHFPVFLHPATGEEYALARRERSTGNGYGEFAFETEGVTLEEDLMRRDFTMNSMALDPETNEIIDPYGGQEDIKSKLIRHTSDAFVEDPLRILRALRLAVRYDFAIMVKTESLMRRMVIDGMASSLSNERVYKELEKVYNEGGINKFIERGFWHLGIFGHRSNNSACFLTETIFEYFDLSSLCWKERMKFPKRHNSFNEWLAGFINIYNRMDSLKLKTGSWIPDELSVLIHTSEAEPATIENPFEAISPAGFYSRFKRFQSRKRVSQWVRCSNFKVNDGYLILNLLDRWHYFLETDTAVFGRQEIIDRLEGKGRQIQEALDEFYIDWFEKELGYK